MSAVEIPGPVGTKEDHKQRSADREYIGSVSVLLYDIVKRYDIYVNFNIKVNGVAWMPWMWAYELESHAYDYDSITQLERTGNEYIREALREGKRIVEERWWIIRCAYSQRTGL